MGPCGVCTQKCCQQLTALWDQVQHSESEGDGETERIFCTWRNTKAAARWPLQLKALELPGESFRWWIDGWPPHGIIWALSGKGAFTKPASIQYNLHADRPQFLSFTYFCSLESTQKYCSTEGNWGKPYLVFCPQALHIKITKPLKNTSLFLMNAKAVKELPRVRGQTEFPRKACQNALLPGRGCAARVCRIGKCNIADLLGLSRVLLGSNPTNAPQTLLGN